MLFVELLGPPMCCSGQDTQATGPRESEPKSEFPPFGGTQSSPEIYFNMVDSVEARPNTAQDESSIKHVFSGTLVHSTADSMMDVCQNRIIGVDNNGKVTESGHFAKQFDSLVAIDRAFFFSVLFNLSFRLHKLICNGNC